MNLIHIGLGKTATSSLQTHVFPLIPEICENVEYNNEELINMLKSYIYFGYSDKLEMKIKSAIADKNYLISMETLLDWNPSNWERSLKKILKIFGSNNHIIITVKKSESYFRSLYVHSLRQGNIKPPQEFFIKDKEYQRIKNFIPRELKLNYFNVDKYDVEHLDKLCKKYFRKTTIVSVEDLSKLEFLREHYCLDETEIKRMSQSFESSDKVNKSLGSILVKTLLLRERILNFFGLKTLGSNDENLVNILRKGGKYEPSLLYKILFYINRRLPLKEYQLPKNCLINIELNKKNDAYISQSKL